MIVDDSSTGLTAFMKRVEAQGPVAWGFAAYDAEYPSSAAALIERARPQKESLSIR